MIPILCDGVFGALCFLLAFYVTRLVADREKQPMRWLIVFIVIGVSGTTLAGRLLTPRILTWFGQDEVAEYLDSEPMFHRIVTDYPDLRAPLEEALKTGMQAGNRQAGVAAARSLIEQVFPDYLANASDEGLLEFAAATVATLSVLQAADPERCFQFLHPGVAGAIELTAEEGSQQQYDAITAVIVTAPEEQLEPADASDLLEGVADTMVQRYGHGFQALAAPEEPGVDRAQICGMTLDMYQEILKLPEDDASRLLRSLFDQ